MDLKYISKSNQETKDIAKNFAQNLKGNEVIIVDGEMGSGKTAFCQGLGKGLGVKRTINSPTFNLVKVYKGNKYTLYHFDCYRLENLKGNDNGLNFDTYLSDENGIIYIEWSEFLYDDLYLIDTNRIIRIDIKILDENEREIHIYDNRK